MFVYELYYGNVKLINCFLFTQIQDKWLLHKYTCVTKLLWYFIIRQGMHHKWACKQQQSIRIVQELSLSHLSLSISIALWPCSLPTHDKTGSMFLKRLYYYEYAQYRHETVRIRFYLTDFCHKMKKRLGMCIYLGAYSSSLNTFFI